MANAVPTNRVTVTVQDYSKETSETSFSVKQFADGASYAAWKSSLVTQMSGISGGTYKYVTDSLNTFFAGAPPTDPDAQRERKWLVRMEDNTTGRISQFTIPTATVTALTFKPNTDEVDLSVAPAPALIAVIEEGFINTAGNPCSVDSIELVGRNL